MLEALGYNPSKHLPRITAPIFFRVGLKDHLCPPEILHAALDRAGLPEVRMFVGLFGYKGRRGKAAGALVPQSACGWEAAQGSDDGLLAVCRLAWRVR